MKTTIVIYGSSTGSCQSIAETIASKLGVEAVDVANIDDATIASHENLILGTSTWGAGEIQDIADFVGDSLALARKAAETDAKVMVMCGVHFMAETCKLLSPDKTVLCPDLNAGCSLADSCKAEDLKKYKEEHPGSIP